MTIFNDTRGSNYADESAYQAPKADNEYVYKQSAYDELIDLYNWNKPEDTEAKESGNRPTLLTKRMIREFKQDSEAHIYEGFNWQISIGDEKFIHRRDLENLRLAISHVSTETELPTPEGSYSRLTDEIDVVLDGGEILGESDNTSNSDHKYLHYINTSRLESCRTFRWWFFTRILDTGSWSGTNIGIIFEDGTLSPAKFSVDPIGQFGGPLDFQPAPAVYHFMVVPQDIPEALGSEMPVRIKVRFLDGLEDEIEFPFSLPDWRVVQGSVTEEVIDKTPRDIGIDFGANYTPPLCVSYCPWLTLAGVQRYLPCTRVEEWGAMNDAERFSNGVIFLNRSIGAAQAGYNESACLGLI